MTLVVFQKKENNIFICADMKMEWREDLKTPENIRSWRPKIIIIRNDLVFCWAGELVFAQDALKEIWNKRLTITIDNLKEFAFKHHIRSRNEGGHNDTDFIVSNNVDISYKISDGNCEKIEGDAYFSYIGSDDLLKSYLSASEEDVMAHNRFLVKIIRLSDQALKNMPTTLASMNSKMINSSELYNPCNKLGHVTTPVTGSVRNGFIYNLHLLIDTKHAPPNLKNTWETIDLGNLCMGSYAYQIVPLLEDNHHILVYENLYNKKKYVFGDFSQGVPEFNSDFLRLPK